MTINKWNVLPLLIALGLLIGSFVKVAVHGTWTAHLYELAFVLAGFCAFCFSEQFAAFTGNYGWTREQWYQDPDWAVKLAGGITLLVCSNMILDLI